jgi:hypothetical protein
MGYADVNPNTTQEGHVQNLTGIASTAMARMLFFQKSKLLGVKSLVVTAGTNDAAGVDILVGTTSVGAITHGTDTAGEVNTSGALNVEIPAGSYVELKGKATSATMVNSYTIVTQPRHDDAATF